MILVAVIGIVPALITGFVTWHIGKPTTKTLATVTQITDAGRRLEDALRASSGYQKKIYPQLGFGFIAPKAWQVEDYATRFGVADIDVIQRYTDTKAAIGVKFKLMPVQPNYVNDLVTETANQSDVWRHIDPDLRVSDATISGFQAKRFDYSQSTGARRGQVCAYWIRIVPEVKLQILCFTYTDEPDKEAFWKEVERVVGSTIIDRELLERRRSNSG